MTRFLIIALVAAACSRSEPASNKTATPPSEGHHEDRSEPAIAAPPLSLEVKIGDTSATWNQDVFDRVSHHAGTNNSGQSRDTWSLRDLVHDLDTSRRCSVAHSHTRSQTGDADRIDQVQCLVHDQ